MQRAGDSSYDVVVVGAGPVGLAASTFLARLGLTVIVVEQREDPRIPQKHWARSIGLTLCSRGLRALGALGLGERLGPMLRPVIGRQVHAADGTADLQRYDLVGAGALYSIRRSKLVELLLAAAREAGVTIRFRARCTDVDERRQTLAVADADASGGRETWGYRALLCTDGANSGLRGILASRYGAREQVSVLPEAFKELGISAEMGKGLAANALHVWPRGERLLVALPNADGSFSASLFMPCGAGGFGEVRTRADVRALLASELPQLQELVPNADSQLIENALGRMVTVQCDRWSYPGGVLIIGDAAHAMPPFYGQGVNCALEGCQLLAGMVEERGPQFDRIFTDFEQLRREDVAVVSQVSHDNRQHLGKRVAEDSYRVSREIDTAVQTHFPEQFMPLYAMIAFTTMSYSAAYRRAAYQASVLQPLIAGLSAREAISKLLAEKQPLSWSPLPSGIEGARMRWLAAAAVDFPHGESRPSNVSELRQPLERRTQVGQLSFSQERIWCFEKFWPENTGFTLCIPLLLRGQVNVAALQDALRMLVDRHEALRTRIVEEEGGVAVQVVEAPGTFATTLMPRPDRTGATKELCAGIVARYSSKRMNLAERLFEAYVCELSAAECLLLLRMHHIVADRQSVGIMTRELCALYRAIVDEHAVALPPPASQLADYVRFERSGRGAAKLADGLQFWRERLAGARDLQWPVQGRGSEVLGDEMRAVIEEMGVAEARFLEMARTAGVSAFVAALTCYFVMLAVVTGQPDISVGCVVANRAMPQALETVGCLFNTVVIRCAAVRDGSFMELLRRVKRATSEALAYQHVPVDAVVKQLGLSGTLSRRPLCQAMFAYREIPESLDLGNVEVIPLHQTQVPVPTELAVEFVRQKSGAKLVCQYSTELFDEGLIGSWIRGLVRIMKAAAVNPGAAVSELALEMASQNDGATHRGRLPDAPTDEKTASEVSATGRKVALDEALAQLWRELLNVEQVDPNDNFFTLGGDSLLATRLSVRIEAQLHVKIATREIFRAANFTALVRAVEGSEQSHSDVIPRRVVRRR